MWLINTTSPEQKRGIADYFAPASVSESSSGSGGILGGTALGEDGNKQAGSIQMMEQMAPEAPPAEQEGQTTEIGADALRSISEEALRDELQPQEAAAFASAAASLRQAMQSLPELAELSKHVLVDQTPKACASSLSIRRAAPCSSPAPPAPTTAPACCARVARVNQLPTGSPSRPTSARPGRAEGDGRFRRRAPTHAEILQNAGVTPTDLSGQRQGGVGPLYPTTRPWRQPPHHPVLLPRPRASAAGR
jgi:chemotaxis protein MotB